MGVFSIQWKYAASHLCPCWSFSFKPCPPWTRSTMQSHKSPRDIDAFLLEEILLAAGLGGWERVDPEKNVGTCFWVSLIGSWPSNLKAPHCADLGKGVVSASICILSFTICIVQLDYIWMYIYIYTIYIHIHTYINMCVLYWLWTKWLLIHNCIYI